MLTFKIETASLFLRMPINYLMCSMYLNRHFTFLYKLCFAWGLASSSTHSMNMSHFGISPESSRTAVGWTPEILLLQNSANNSLLIKSWGKDWVQFIRRLHKILNGQIISGVFECVFDTKDMELKNIWNDCNFANSRSLMVSHIKWCLQMNLNMIAGNKVFFFEIKVTLGVGAFAIWYIPNRDYF